MNLLNQLTIKNLKLNRKRSIVTIIGIMLSVALLTAVSSMYASLISSSIAYEVSYKGNYHVEIDHVSASERESIRNNAKIEKAAVVFDEGYAVLKGSQNAYKPYAYVCSFDENAMEMMLPELLEGRLPENKNEVLISDTVRTNGKVNLKVGDLVTLDIGTRIDTEGTPLSQNDDYYGSDEERIIDTTSRTYTIVGRVKRPSTAVEPYTAPGYTFITAADGESSETANVFLLFNQNGLKQYASVTANILGVDAELFGKAWNQEYRMNESELAACDEMMSQMEHHFSMNTYLIQLETNPFSISSNKTLGIMVIVVLGIILVTSVYCIRNSFDISITEKIRQYGMLKSIGATSRQIRKNVLFEASILGLFGIPLGLCLGLFATRILVWVSNTLLFSSVEEGIVLLFSISIPAILVSVLIGIVTIYLSALRSAGKAGKVSPIESIRNAGEIAIRSKKLKTPKIVQKLFGMGGVIAYKNTKRNQKRYRTTIISLTVSVATFIALSYFTSLMSITVTNELSSVQVDYSMTLDDYAAVKKEVENVTHFDGVKDYSIIRNDVFTIENPSFSNETLKYMEVDSAEYPIGIMSLGDAAFKKYCENLGIQNENMRNQAILIDQSDYYHEDKNGEMHMEHFRIFSYETNQNLHGKAGSYIESDTGGITLQIAAVSDIYPLGMNYAETALIVSDETFDALESENKSATANFVLEDTTQFVNEVEATNLADHIVMSSNRAEQHQREMNVILLIKIFLYGFIIVITLIGVTNIINTITTSMELRKREFATLKSIGMTQKEFKQMIYFESLLIGGKSLLYGTMIGSILSVILYRIDQSGSPFHYPFLPLAGCIVAVMVLMLMIMRYAMQKISRQNTIETIRNENV